MRAKSKKSWWAPIAHFATHAAQGMAIFVIIALVAYGVDHFVDWLQEIGASGFEIMVLRVVADVMVVVDAISFVWYILRTAYLALKEW